MWYRTMLLNNGSAGGTFRKNLVLEVAIFVLNCAFRNWRHTGWLVRTRASEGSSDSDIMVRRQHIVYSLVPTRLRGVTLQKTLGYLMYGLSY